MADACFTARSATRDLVYNQIIKLSFPTTANKQYNHAAGHKFCINVK